MAAETALKERERDARDDEIVRLKGKVGAMTMEIELLYDKIARLRSPRAGSPARAIARSGHGCVFSGSGAHRDASAG